MGGVEIEISLAQRNSILVGNGVVVDYRRAEILVNNTKRTAMVLSLCRVRFCDSRSPDHGVIVWRIDFDKINTYYEGLFSRLVRLRPGYWLHLVPNIARIPQCSPLYTTMPTKSLLSVLC